MEIPSAVAVIGDVVRSRSAADRAASHAALVRALVEVERRHPAILPFAPTVGDALKFFYTLLSVSLFVPIVAGLFLRRTGVPEVLAAMLGGVALTAATQLGFAQSLPAGITPAMVGIGASLVAWGRQTLVILWVNER